VTFAERVTALGPFGFTERQARFVATAALHGGYFLRRQYLEFTGQTHGKNTVDFLDRLLERKLATATLLRGDRGHIFHLSARSIYAALDQPDNRNRRRATPPDIARKLMLLDYVISEPAVTWIATERDKVSLFTQQFSIDARDLPCRLYRSARRAEPTTTRYFVDKLPLGAVGTPPVVRFVYLVLDTTGAGVQAFLGAYASLFAHLSAWQLALVCPPHIDGLGAGEAVFHRFSVASTLAFSEQTRDELQWFFKTRELVDGGSLRDLSVDDLARFRERRAQYAGPRNEALYARWRANGWGALVDTTAPLLRGGHLLMHRLPFRYDQFGSLAGLA
jgi:hypothetical protein